MKSFPDTILLKIFSYLRTDELAQVSRVNSKWHRVALDWRLWQRVSLKNYANKIGDLHLRKLIKDLFPAKIQYLDLSGFKISTGTLHALSVRCPQLISLNLDSVDFHETYQSSPQVAYFPRNLRKLNMANSTGPSSVYRNLSKSLYVDCLECFGGGDRFLASLGSPTSHKFKEFFLRQRWSLKILEFAYCNELTDHALTFILFCCRNLQSVCIRRCRNLEGTFLRSVFAIAPSLRCLVLDGTMIKDEVIRLIPWQKCFITELDFSWCRHLKESGLLASLPELRFLRCLQVSCCGYGHALTDKVLDRMARRPWTLLEVLDLSYSCEITNRATREFLLRSTKLQYVGMNHCRKLTQSVFENIPYLSNVDILASFPLAKGSVIVNDLPKHLIDTLAPKVTRTPSFIRHFSMSKEMRSES